MILPIKRYTHTYRHARVHRKRIHRNTSIQDMKSLYHLLQKCLPHPQSLSYSLPFTSPGVSWFTLETRNTSSQLPSLLVNNISRNRKGMPSPFRLPTGHQLCRAPSHLMLSITLLHLPAGKVAGAQGMLGFVVSTCHKWGLVLPMES